MFFGGVILLRLDPQAFSINYEIHVSPNLCKENAVEKCRLLKFKRKNVVEGLVLTRRGVPRFRGPV